MPKEVSKSDGGSTAADSSMEINVHVEGLTIPITLTHEKCTSTSSGELCKDFVENSLTNVDPRLILQILTKISPAERLTHYVMRYGDGYSSIIHVEWSSADIPGFVRLPLVPAYIDVNMTLKPRKRGAPTKAKPHLPLQPAGISLPTSIDVNLCISLVSTEEPPYPSNVARTSVVHLKEHGKFPGCVDTFSVEAADGQNNILPETAHVPGASTAASAAIVVTTATAAAGKKRKAPPKDQTTTAPVKAKAKSSKKKKEETTKPDDSDGAKKPAAKEGKGKGGAAAAAAKKSPPPKESSSAGLKSPPKKSGLDMIRVYKEAKELEAAKAKQLEESSSSKPDSASIPKVISSKKTTKASLKKDKGKKTAAKDTSKKPSTIEVERERAPSADVGNEMIRRYEEAKAKEIAAENEKTPSKKSGDSTKSSSSKKAKGSSKKDKAKVDVGKSAKKSSSAAAAVKEYLEDTAAPSVDAGNKMIRLYEEAKAKENAAEKEKAASKKSDSTKPPSSKKAKGSSKKDDTKADEGESAKKPSVAEGGKSAKKKAKATDSEATKVSKKKKRKAPTDSETSDAPKSPTKKKAKTSTADKLTPSKVDDKKSAATKNGESEKKKRGPKPKDYTGIPSEPAKDLPEGWTLKNIPRSVGDKYDQKWYSPGGIAFRSKKGAMSFIEIVNDGKDEAAAYVLFEKGEKKAKELRKAEREEKKKKDGAESVVV